MKAILVKLFICPVTKDLQSVADVHSHSVETTLQAVHRILFAPQSKIRTKTYYNIKWTQTLKSNKMLLMFASSIGRSN